MKKIKLLLLAVIAVTLFNCGDDDSPSAELTAASVSGTYDITLFEEQREERTTSSSGAETVIETTTSEGDTFTNAIFTFTTSGTFSQSGNYRETITVTNGNGTTTGSAIKTFSDSGTFSVDITSRTLTLNGLVYDVTVFDGTNLYFDTTFAVASSSSTIETERRYRLVKRN